jgi:hypothetical protein
MADAQDSEPSAVFGVMSSPAKPQDEEAFNDWYDNLHIPQVVAGPGFRSATRYKLVQQAESVLPAYLTTCELDTEDPVAAVQEMRNRVTAGEITLTDVMATDPRPESALYVANSRTARRSRIAEPHTPPLPT